MSCDDRLLLTSAGSFGRCFGPVMYVVQLSEDPIGWLGLFWELRPVSRAVSGAVSGARDYVICALMW
ncbi:MAG: hypothetical protein JWR01_2967 [Subtercola sp.]|nr:hypothetical protein [Subtercola sp.]